MEGAVPRPKQNPRQLQQRSRLQRHAPSTIQVDAPPADGSECRVVIPLLSPLDNVAVPQIPDEAAGAAAHQMTEPSTATDSLTEGWKLPEAKAKKNQKHEAEEDLRFPGWQHPAAPFFYEPAPGNLPVFLLPNQFS